MSCENDCPQNAGSTIGSVLQKLGARTVEGDQGRWTGYTVDEAIKAVEFEQRQSLVRGCGGGRRRMAGALRAMNYRLVPHDGRGT